MKLVAIDLDGTLLSEDGTISRENRDAVLEAQKKGCIVVISSGRSLHDTEHILETAGIEAPIISGNGAIALESGRILHNLQMPAEVVSEIIALLKDDRHYFELYTNEGVVVYKNGRAQLEKEIRDLQEIDAEFPMEWAVRLVEIQYEQYGLRGFERYEDINPADAGIYKIFVFSFDRQRIEELKGRLTGRLDISITTSGWTKLEIAHPDASKGNALKLIARHFGIPLEETGAIGDNLNDLSMFQIAGTSIAMGNAEAEVRQHSTWVTQSCEENGVAFALRKYV
jgi:5-amino-6-(5-phospho-D-ribitylamino)uracil phosphatase